MSKPAKEIKNYSLKLAELFRAASAAGDLEDLITDWLTPSERKDLWDRGWVLLTVVGLLGVEWALRKKFNLL